MVRCIPFFLTLLAAGCTRPSSTQAAQEDNSSKASRDDIKLAKDFMKEIKKNKGYMAGDRDAVRDQVDREHLDSQALLRGFLELLQRGTPEERRRSARFLGWLRDPSAINSLVKALEDADEELREQACYGLQSLKAKSKAADSALVKLRRNDPSVDVRVAAALALSRPADKDALAAYQLGLKSTKKGWVREICEDELEKMGKLELPLPQHVYTEITYDYYQQIKAESRRFMVRREIKKADTIYLEVVKHIHHVPLHTEWYRTRADGPGAGEKKKLQKLD